MFTDRVLLAQGTQYGTPEVVVSSVVAVLTQYAYAVTSAIVLLRFRWWAPLVLVAGIVPLRRSMHVEVDAAFSWLEGGAEAMRRSRYYRDLALSPGAAKEIRVFGLAGWVLGRVFDSWRDAIVPVWRKRKALRGRLVLAGVAVAAAYAVVFGGLVISALGGGLTLAALVVYAQAATAMSQLGYLVSNDSYYFTRTWHRALDHLDGLSTATSAARLFGVCTDVSLLPQDEIEFDRVSFAYPGAGRSVFDALSLRLRAGSSSAIVGVNGVGKTTLVKLLTRLYDPAGGRILVDGTDMRALDPAAWRSRVSVIFQDFVRYELPARDNVALEARSCDTELDEAARLAGADAVLRELSAGWDTVLSRGYRGGTDLSGGQWQRMALARAVLGSRGGGVLVLDEPTANLDVRAEAELFDRFLDVTRGTTAILISHRFSSVRHAERIFVLEHGLLVEEGSHDELMAVPGGRYRTMFGLQAERFQGADV